MGCIGFDLTHVTGLTGLWARLGVRKTPGMGRLAARETRGTQ
jgi:hypothetical protein